MVLPPPPEMTGEQLVHQLASMKSRRANFDTQFQEVKDLLWPDGGDFTYQRSPGEKTNLEILDAHAVLYLEMGASVFETLLTPRTQRWHRLVADKPELMKIGRVKDWFEDATDQLFTFRNAHRARFASQIHEHWKSILAYGNANLFVRDLPTGGTSYRSTHIGQSWIDVDYDGVIDTIFYEYPLTARAACQRWKDKAPECAKNALSVDPATEHMYLHAVLPNPNYDAMKALPEHMAFVAYEVSLQDKRILERGGYHENPYMWSRYTVNSSEIYGRGAGMLVLPDIKTLQQMERTMLRTGQKVADPPLLAVDDGVLGRGDRKIRLGAGRITPGGLSPDGRPLIVPLNMPGRLDITYEMIQGRRDLIRRAFHVDFYELLVQDRVEMTATEVLQRSNEKGQLLAPVVGRQQSELLGPLIDREIKIAQRQRRLPPLPPELIEAQGEYKVEYESDATRMQKSAEVAAFSQTFANLLPFFEANPSALEVFKIDDAIRHVFEITGGRTSLTHTEDELKRMRQAQAEAEEERAALEALPGAAKGVRDLAEASAKAGRTRAA